MAKNYWLMKSEPGSYSIDDLERDGKTHWDGVRNYQARNFMRDQMKVGDRVLFYHSSSNPPGVAGLATVVREGYPDTTAFQKKDPHFDPKSSPENPRWFGVDIAFDSKLDQIVALQTLKDHPELGDMVVTKRSRLSVQPVTAAEFKIVEKLGRKKES